VSLVIARRHQAYNDHMSDFILIAATIVFFAICTFYVKWCDKIIGPDELQTDDQNEAAG
jgi:hypothetical protein